MNYKAILFVLLIAPLCITAQTKSSQVSPILFPAPPESVGVSSERLAKIDLMIESSIKNQDIPGAVALIARGGKIVFHKAYGTVDSKGRPAKTDDIFRIASQTKAITSTAVMMLWEEGKFGLDEPISKFIPEFKDPQVLKTYNEKEGTYTTEPANQEITIRHLLTHTSGIGYGVIDGNASIKAIYAKAGVTDLFTTEKITIEESVKKLAKLPLHHHPGEDFTYSEGLDVLGYFIEVVSGQPFDSFLKERILDPLDMNDTWFYLPKEKANRLVEVQEFKDEKWSRLPKTFYDQDYPKKGAKSFFSGGAGLCSTVKDYATFLQMYLNNGELNGIRLLSRTTIQSMMGNQTGDKWENNSFRHYGLAFGVITPPGQDLGGWGSIGTFDWGGYFNTQYFADPKEQIIGLIFKQTSGPTTDQTGSKFRIMVGAAIDD